MITLIHGDDTAASRAFYLEQKKRVAQPVALEADKVTLTDLVQVLTGGGLFAEEKDIFIESLLSKKKKSAELTAMLTELSNAEANIFLWESKEIDKRTISSFKNISNQVFKLPQSLFIFLDNLSPGNSRLLPLFHKTLETTEAEMIFFMLIRHLRTLLALSSPTSDPIDELKRLAPWQQTKLQKQVRQFTPESLTRAYRSLYDIDLGVKTGSSPLPLISSIDIWLLDL